MKRITCQELKSKMDRNDKFILINALNRNRFRAEHIPGSINIQTRSDVETYLKKGRRDRSLLHRCGLQPQRQPVLLAPIHGIQQRAQILGRPDGMVTCRL